MDQHVLGGTGRDIDTLLVEDGVGDLGAEPAPVRRVAVNRREGDLLIIRHALEDVAIRRFRIDLGQDHEIVGIGVFGAAQPCLARYSGWSRFRSDIGAGRSSRSDAGGLAWAGSLISGKAEVGRVGRRRRCRRAGPAGRPRCGCDWGVPGSPSRFLSCAQQLSSAQMRADRSGNSGLAPGEVGDFMGRR